MFFLLLYCLTVFVFTLNLNHLLTNGIREIGNGRNFYETSFLGDLMSSDTPHDTKDVIFIGKKPIMAYVTSALIQLANNPKVSIKARGLSIGRAVDVAQIIARRTDNSGYSIGQIKIGSEQLQSLDGRSRNVSTIEIEVMKNA